MPEKKTLDIILPCYNPPKGWGKYAVDRFKKLELERSEVDFGLIIINDDSKNDVEEDVRFIKGEIPNLIYDSHSPNRGKGFTLRHGIEKSQADWQIITDIDFPYEHESTLALIDSLLEGNDVVVGVRGDEYYENVPKSRTRLSKFVRKLLKSVLKLPVSDTQCGLKGFNSKGKEVFLTTSINRYLFDMEFIYLLHNNYKTNITPLNVSLRDGVVFSKLNLKIFTSEAVNFLQIFFKR